MSESKIFIIFIWCLRIHYLISLSRVFMVRRWRIIWIICCRHRSRSWEFNKGYRNLLFPLFLFWLQVINQIILEILNVDLQHRHFNVVQGFIYEFKIIIFFWQSIVTFSHFIDIWWYSYMAEWTNPLLTHVRVISVSNRSTFIASYGGRSCDSAA